MPSDAYFIAPVTLVSTTTSCWQCGAHTQVFALEVSGIIDPVVPAEGQEDLDAVALLQHLRALPDSITSELATAAPNFNIDFSKTLHASVWMNHCDACGTRIGDTYLQSSGPLNRLWSYRWCRREIVRAGSYPLLGGYRL